MGYAVTTFFLGCILLLSVRIGALNIGPDAGAGAGGGVTSGGAQTSPDTGAGAGGGATAVAGAAAGGQVTVDGAATGAGAAGAGAAPSAGTAASSAGGGAVSPSTSSGAGLPSASSDATPGTNISTRSAGAGIVGASGTGAGVGTAASSAGSGAAAPSASSGVTPGAGTATLSVGAGAGVDDAGAAAGAAAGNGGAAAGAGAGAGDVGVRAGAGGTVAGANASVVAGAGAGNAGAAAGDVGVGAGGGAAGIVDAGAGATGGGGAGAATGAGGVGAAAGAGGPGAATDAGGAGFGTAGGASAPAGAGAPIVPCYFIFGDSLADCGNNNELKTLAKANFLPYGVDYPSGPTGRFTNGRTYVDFIAEYLGFPNHIPPYAAVRGSERVLQGVNYASAGAGIRPETGKILGERVNLDSQLDHHTLTIARIKELKGNNDAATQQYLGKCLYTVGIGSNDYMSNYLLAPANPNDVVFTPDTWAAELGRRIDDFLRKLHSLGARKVALYGLGPIGCEPAQVKLLRNAGKQGCAENVNQMISLYNGKLAPIVDGVNKLPDAKFIFVNISHISPAGTGIKVYDEPCCPTEAVAGSCVRNSTPCPNRGEYAFFDSFHPTEKTVLPAATRAWKALEPQDTYPMDISRLVKL